MSEFKQKPLMGLISKSVALVAAVLVFVVAVLLIADHVRLLKMDPLNDPVLLELRAELANSAESSDAVVEKIRTYDLYARRAFFANEEQRRSGGLLLLSGAVVCFVALKLSNHWKPKLPTVGKSENPDHWELNNLFRQLMAGTGIFLVVVSLFLAFVVQSDLAVVLKRADEQAGKPAPPVGQTFQSALSGEMKFNWPSLRGPGGIGHARMAEAPISWDVETGDGVLWKEEVFVHGFNSPIVWNDRIFMSGADDEGQEVFCHDVNSGKELWATTIETEGELPEVSEDTGYAAPTMATDGTLVFAIFASGDLAALDFDGKIVWQKNIGVPDNPYGMGSSLISDGQRLFVQYDHSDEQKVMAFDVANGDELWRTARNHISWSSPVLIEPESGMQLILNDEENVTAYDPVSGKQLWQVKCLGGEVAPSAAFNGKDIVFVANEYAQATALKLNGGIPEILWQYDEYLPEIASPLVTEKYAFIATTVGDLIGLDIQTGEVKWEQECDDGFNASPILVGNNVYAIDLGGVVHIFDAEAESYHEIASIEMGEPVYTTPAFVNGRIYIRGDENLFCIGDD
ncbi:PQQ-binding-like beta-propeller repeat protein [Pontiellaceae bacterium B1224]|nr:PQQ-binding-like beta-propeller repeat protein [Pontiellaceae bacterium B1224]